MTLAILYNIRWWHWHLLKFIMQFPLPRQFYLDISALAIRSIILQKEKIQQHAHGDVSIHILQCGAQNYAQFSQLGLNSTNAVGESPLLTRWLCLVYLKMQLAILAIRAPCLLM